MSTIVQIQVQKNHDCKNMNTVFMVKDKDKAYIVEPDLIFDVQEDFIATNFVLFHPAYFCLISFCCPRTS